MGQTMLCAPVELVRVQRSGNEHYRAAVAELQGVRSHHEDGHSMRCSGATGSFWVLDGHGGDGAAKFCSPRLGEEFTKTPYADDDAICEGFQAIDSRFREHVMQCPEQDSGSTVVGIVTQRRDDSSYSVKLTNAGDSRGLIIRGPDAAEMAQPLEVRIPRHLAALGSSSFACGASVLEPEFKEANRKGGHSMFSCRWPVIAESVDHKPDHPTEQARIIAANGYVTQHEDPPRLDGNLAVSRGLGDFEYKGDDDRPASEQKVTLQNETLPLMNSMDTDELVESRMKLASTLDTFSSISKYTHKHRVLTMKTPLKMIRS